MASSTENVSSHIKRQTEKGVDESNVTMKQADAAEYCTQRKVPHLKQISKMKKSICCCENEQSNTDPKDVIGILKQKNHNCFQTFWEINTFVYCYICSQAVSKFSRQQPIIRLNDVSYLLSAHVINEQQYLSCHTTYFNVVR